MTGLRRLYTRARPLLGVAVPLVVLSVALLRVDPALFAGAVFAFGAVFGLSYGYARYVGLGEERDGERPWTDRSDDD